MSVCGTRRSLLKTHHGNRPSPKRKVHFSPLGRSMKSNSASLGPCRPALDPMVSTKDRAAWFPDSSKCAPLSIIMSVAWSKYERHLPPACAVASCTTTPRRNPHRRTAAESPASPAPIMCTVPSSDERMPQRNPQQIRLFHVKAVPWRGPAARYHVFELLAIDRSHDSGRSHDPTRTTRHDL